MGKVPAAVRRVLAAWAVCSLLAASGGEPVSPAAVGEYRAGETVWRDTFANPVAWRGGDGARFVRAEPLNEFVASLVDADGPDAADHLLVERDAFGRKAETRKKTVAAQRDLTEELLPWAGCEVEVRVAVKATDVPEPEIPWEGVRVVLNYRTPVSEYGASVNGVGGTFDWREETLTTRIPANASRIEATLGMVGDAGEVRMRDLRVVLKDAPRRTRVPSATPRHKGHDRPALRGLNSAQKDKIREMAEEWRANVMKYTMVMPAADLEPEAERAYLEKHFRAFDDARDAARDVGALLVFQIAVGAKGTRDEGPTRSDLFYVIPEYADRFVRIWGEIAERYRGDRTVWGFELLNESVLRITRPRPGCPDYETLMERAARAVNAVDPERTVIVQPEEWWGMNAFDKLRPIRADNVVYAVHFYAPTAITHQNLFTVKTPPVAYPGNVGGVEWNREALRSALRPALDFQRAYNVHLFVSEFSCIRWAPGAERWLDDAISLFEEYGWDWLYHDIYAWPGWDPRLDGDRDMGKREMGNPRETVLKKWLRRNDHSAEKGGE